MSSDHMTDADAHELVGLAKSAQETMHKLRVEGEFQKRIEDAVAAFCEEALADIDELRQSAADGYDTGAVAIVKLIDAYEDVKTDRTRAAMDARRAQATSAQDTIQSLRDAVALASVMQLGRRSAHRRADGTWLLGEEGTEAEPGGFLRDESGSIIRRVTHADVVAWLTETKATP